jgi:hypothetical protein
MDDPTAPLEQAADRLDHAIAYAHALGRSDEVLRLQSLQMSVRDALRNYRALQSAGAFKSAFSKNFLSVA